MDKNNKENEEERTSLTNEQVEEIREILTKYESDDYEGITLVNACEAMNDLGIFYTEAETQEMFKEFDLDENEKIPVDYFHNVISKIYQQLKDIESVKAAFRVFDTDYVGSFKTTELRSFALNLGVKFTDEEFEDMINEVDVDRDGKISWEEFVAALKP